MDGDSNNSSNEENIIGEFRYDAERRDQGISIETIKEWFPPATTQGKLPRSVLRAIWERYPEPAEAVLKTSSIDIDLADGIPAYALTNDTDARDHIRNFASAFKPIISMALAIQEDNTIPRDTKEHLLAGLREATLLHNHAKAIAEIDRRQKIGKAARWSNSLMARCNTTASDDRANLFGNQFNTEYRRWRQEKLTEETLTAQKEAINKLARSVSAIKVATNTSQAQNNSQPYPKPRPQFKTGAGPKPQHPKGPKGNQ